MSNNTLKEPRWLAWISHSAGLFCAVLLVVMTAIISWQIFGRYVLNDTPKWSEQLAGVLMVYLTMIGGALAVRDQVHIALTFFHDRFSPAWQRRCWYLIQVLLLGFGAVMAVYGVRMAALVHEWTIPTLGLSQGANYWAFPVSGVLIVVYCILRLLSGPGEQPDADGETP